MKNNYLGLFFLCFIASSVKANISQAVIFYSGAESLTKTQVDALSAYDLIITDRFRFKDVAGNSWRYIKRKNADSQILLYQLGPVVSKHSEQYKPYYLNNIGQYYEMSKKDTAAKANKLPTYFIPNLLGRHTHVKGYEHYLWLDFSEPHIQDLWFLATKKDVVDRRWRADGIFMDLGLAYPFSYKDYVRGLVPEKYKEPAEWGEAMNDFIAHQTVQLNDEGQLYGVNRSYSATENGYIDWIKLDKSISAPDFIMEENAFFNHYGPSDIQWLSEKQWWRQIEMSQQVNQSSIIFVAQTDIPLGGSGKDNFGNQIDYCQALRFAALSTLLAKKKGRSDYLIFNENRTKKRLRNISYKEMLNELDVGNPEASVEIEKTKNGLIYKRQFEHATVYVNPGNKPIALNLSSKSEIFPWACAAKVNSEKLAPKDAILILRQ
jgi:hypothetical protein